MIFTHLESFAAFLMLFELALEVGKPLADLVQLVVQLAVRGVVLVELGLVSDPLLLAHDGRVSPVMKTTIIGAVIWKLG